MFGHSWACHKPWKYIAISAGLLGAGCLVLLHFGGACDQAVNPSRDSDCFGSAMLVHKDNVKSVVSACSSRFLMHSTS